MLRYLVPIMLFLFLGFTLAACGGESVDPDAPPEIAYGEDTCSRCGMIISEEKYASGMVDPDGTTEVFDDIGGMIIIVQAEGLGERLAWVHDYNTVEWIDATTSYYAVSDEVITPMGFGVLAFGTKEAAESFVEEQAGAVMTWEEMVSDWNMAEHQN